VIAIPHAQASEVMEQALGDRVRSSDDFPEGSSKI